MIVKASLAIALLVGFALLRATGTRSTPDDAHSSEADVAEYIAELDRLGAQGGQVVVDGMRPGLADIAQHRFADGVLARMADGWVDSMRNVQDEVRNLEVPASLSGVAVRVERALSVYVRVAETLRDAATASGSSRDALIDEAVNLGQEADHLYDEARAMLDEVRS